MGTKAMDRLRQTINLHSEAEDDDKVEEAKKLYEAEECRRAAMKTWPCNIWDLGE
jgi:hypothetical protein